jgi:hypothetical protein
VVEKDARLSIETAFKAEMATGRGAKLTFILFYRPQGPTQ